MSKTPIVMKPLFSWEELSQNFQLTRQSLYKKLR